VVEEEDGSGSRRVERRDGGRALIFMRKGKGVSWVKKKGENPWLKHSNRINGKGQDSTRVSQW
jgi:hypothetical protein